ncbi:MAG: hypothetical protein ACLVAK_09925 [Clostridia bacterium]
MKENRNVIKTEEDMKYFLENFPNIILHQEKGIIVVHPNIERFLMSTWNLTIPEAIAEGYVVQINGVIQEKA